MDGATATMGPGTAIGACATFEEDAGGRPDAPLSSILAGRLDSTAAVASANPAKQTAIPAVTAAATGAARNRVLNSIGPLIAPSYSGLDAPVSRHRPARET